VLAISATNSRAPRSFDHRTARRGV